MAVEDAQYHSEFLALYDKGSKCALKLTEDELHLLRLLNKTLDPLVEITAALSGDEYVTASAILPVVYFIQSELDSVQREILDFTDEDYQKKFDAQQRVSLKKKPIKSIIVPLYIFYPHSNISVHFV